MEEEIVMEEDTTNNKLQPPPPKWVFIVPYRDREQQQTFFDRHMRTVILADIPQEQYFILYIHQMDKRGFNRGAMKNIGFLYVRDMWKQDYRNIVLIFNDVDTMPFEKGLVNYETRAGKIKHFYGYKFALGGFFSITAGDFEKINGFPCFFSWAYEDNLLLRRAKMAGLTVDYSEFFPIFDKHIIQFVDSIEKTVNKKEYDLYTNDTQEGIQSITNLQYNYDVSTGFVNVVRFSIGRDEEPQYNKQHNLLQGSKPFPNSGVGARKGRGGMMKMQLQ